MKLLVLLSLSCVLWTAEPFFAAFDPPKGWVISDPSRYDKGVQIGFIASNKRIFTPSITLSYETVGTVDLPTYLKAVRKNFLRDRRTTVQELGTLKTKDGEGVLLQIDQKNRFGDIRLLQAISLHNGKAIIHTASCTKDDFLNIHEALLKSFKSLTIYPNLASSCPTPALREKLEEMEKCWKKYLATSKGSKEKLFASSFFQNNQWKPFVNYVEKELDSQGSCWQILAINHIKETLLMENEK